MTEWEIRRALWTYLEVRKAHEYVAELTSAEIDHSALLGRLLAGKNPLEDPPPLAHSYPWYSLIEDGEGWASPPEDPYTLGEEWTESAFPPDTVIIRQSGQWKLIRKNSEKDWIVECRTNGQTFRCYERDDYPASGRREDGTWGPVYMTGWKLERLPQEELNEE